MIPLACDHFERPARFLQLHGFELPQSFPSGLDIAHQPGLCEHLEMLRHGLASDFRSRRELRNRYRAAGAQHCDEAEPGFVAEGRKDRRTVP